MTPTAVILTIAAAAAVAALVNEIHQLNKELKDPTAAKNDKQR